MDKQQTVFRVRKTSNYVSISRFTLEDKRLSWEARGLHAFLLAKPDDWQTCIAHLIKCSPAGRDKTRRVIKELITNSYIVKNEQRSQQGHFSSPQYIVYESPHCTFSGNPSQPKTENPSMVKPPPARPSPPNHLLLNKQTELSKQRTNKTTTTNDFIWPSKINAKYRESIMSLIAGVDEASAQLLIDELSGKIDSIKNPIGYFRTLLKRLDAGEFIPSIALKTQEVREARDRNAQIIERSHQLAAEKFQLQIKEYERSKK